MTLQVRVGKCRLRVALACWPDVDQQTARFLRSLHWRVRRCVEMTHGEEMTLDQVAAHLRISRFTVSSDLARAYSAYETEVLTDK